MAVAGQTQTGRKEVALSRRKPHPQMEHHKRKPRRSTRSIRSFLFFEEAHGRAMLHYILLWGFHRPRLLTFGPHREALCERSTDPQNRQPEQGLSLSGCGSWQRDTAFPTWPMHRIGYLAGQAGQPRDRGSGHPVVIGPEHL